MPPSSPKAPCMTGKARPVDFRRVLRAVALSFFAVCASLKSKSEGVLEYSWAVEI